MAMGGNKLRKLEFLAADALREGADTVITAGAIQSNHVRQTAAVAAKLGLHCVALLENPIGTRAENYLTNGNRLLLDLFNVQVEMVDALTDPTAQLDELATRLEAQGFRPYVIPVGGSNALGALGYVESALEIAQQCEGAVSLSSVVVASGSAGTHAGLAVGLEQLLPEVELIGVTVSRSVADQKPKVVTLQQAVAEQLELKAKADIELNAMREKAMRDIDNAKKAAVSEIYSHSTQLATTMAGKILRREVNSGDTQRLLDESVAQLSGSRN